MKHQGLSGVQSNRFEICHPHNMCLQHVPEGAEYNCSFCELRGSGSAYVCWQCKVFLHDHCFRSNCSRTDHPANTSRSHPLAPIPTNPPGSVSFDNCNLAITDLSLNLSKMQLDLHIRGACIPNPATPPPSSGHEGTEAPAKPDPTPAPTIAPCVLKTGDKLIESMEHKSHPAHPLKLVFYPPFVNTTQFSTCGACGGTIHDCVYRCDHCNFNLHVKCAFLPEQLSNEEHDNPLTLYYSVQSACDGGSYWCGVCKQQTPNNLWVYYCRTCDYGTEASCVLAKESLKQEIQSFKDMFKPYVNLPSFNEKCKRPARWGAQIF